MDEGIVQNAASVDARDELLQVASLWDFFVEKTIKDAGKWFSQRVGNPPWGLLIVLVAVTLFFIFLLSWVALLFGFFAVALFIWIVLINSGKNQKSLDSVMSSINMGNFPVELKDSISKRLRWWNSLIVPEEWTKNSKIFRIREKLNIRVQELDLEVSYWESREGKKKLEQIAEGEEAQKIRQEEQQKKLKLLKSRGVNVNGVIDEVDKEEENATHVTYSNPRELLRLLKSKGDCDKQSARISKISDPVLRASEERLLVKALLMHTYSVTDLIDSFEELKVSVDTITSENLNIKVKEIIGTLEKRRKLVGKLNRIRPKKIIDLVDYDLKKAQTEISMERLLHG